MPVTNCLFGWHCWRTVEGLAHQLPRLPWESKGWACAPSPLASLIHFSWLNSSFQHKDFLYLIEVITSVNWSHMWYPDKPLVCPCSLVLLLYSSSKNSGCQELGRTQPGWVLARVPPRRGVWQSYLITNLAWYLPCLQLFLSSAVSSLKWLTFLLLIKINVSLLENSTSCLGNISLIIYTLVLQIWICVLE